MNEQSPQGADMTFEPSSAGEDELRRGVTDLSAIELELLVRLDGIAPLKDVRAAMSARTDMEFDAALTTLQRLRLIQRKELDAMAMQLEQQLHMLTPGSAKGSSTAGGRPFAVGLARRRPAREAPPHPRVAVVVEDEPTLAQFVKAFMALEGFEVRLAANRAEVLAAIRQGVPDIVLLDGTLPDVDGFEILRSIRQNPHPQLREVPALMMTARATRDAVLKALEHGADGYLTKPVDADALVTAVRAVTGGLPKT
ncbi:response regulator transcription factor [Ramlibacter albus]|uniref:Response regulator n=1 Tax=Ramlibacter albus TaxID=2079448 RepID=A0A923MAF5_9BURK|nr:response regulator [Ramlibacter albus]MBC5765729.1 response regulator [Ramlibacter albus]